MDIVMEKREKIWIATREYAGIAEAGGVKNVARSLAEGLENLGKDVSVFIPKYGCVEQFSVKLFDAEIPVEGERVRVVFSKAWEQTVEIIFVEAPVFAEKHAVYTYTGEDEKEIPGAVRGEGHRDADKMNALFQLAVLVYAEKTGEAPAVVHCHDGHTAMIAAMANAGTSCCDVRRLFADTVCVTTIHNAGAGYRQTIADVGKAGGLTGLPEAVLRKAVFNGKVEPFLLAAEYGRLSTVSPWYAEELMSPDRGAETDGLSGEFHRRGIKITGITNGIDFYRYDPSEPSRSYLPFPYKPWEGRLEGKYRFRRMLLENIDLLDTGEIVRTGTLEGGENAVFFAYQGRIVEQKGLPVLIAAAEMLLNEIPSARFLIMGQGSPSIEADLEEFAGRHPGKAVFLRGYNKIVARRVICVSDFVVLPSVFEPCGLEDFIGQILGSIPVAHAVGGLQKIQHGKTGFLYTRKEGEAEAGTLAALLIQLAAKVVNSNPGKDVCVQSEFCTDRTCGGGACKTAVCSDVPEYREMITVAAKYVMENCGWDTVIKNGYLPLYGMDGGRL